MSKILTPFERHLKEKVANHEMPYEQGSWFLLQKSMGAAQVGKSPWIVALVATVVVTAASSIGIYNQRHTPSSAHLALSENHFETLVSIVPATGESSNAAFDNSYYNQVSLANTLGSNNNNSDTPSENGSLTSLNENGSTTAQSSNNNSTDNQSGNTINGIESTNPINQTAPIKADNVIGFSSNVRQACEGIEVDFDVTNGPKEGSYLWNFGDGHFSQAVNPKHKFAKAGEYDISLSVTGDKGQISTTVMNDMITIHPSPDADFIWQFINVEPDKPTVKIINNTGNAVDYEWTFSDGSKSPLTDPIIALDKNGKKLIALSAKNNYGCHDGTVKNISVNSDFALNAPNAIVAGKETFMPSGLKQTKVNFVMTIYNEIGEEVFQTSNRLKGWDGKIAGGALPLEGSKFSWKVIITNDITQEQKYFNGILTVSP
jgi:PKD repeat protein